VKYWERAREEAIRDAERRYKEKNAQKNLQTWNGGEKDE
jgi:hypothetical protein